MAENEESQRLREQLNQAQLRLAQVTEMLQLGEWEYNQRTGRFSLSPRLKAILGYRDDELPAEAKHLYDLLHPDDRDYVSAGFRAFISQPDAPFILEFRVRHREGCCRWVRNHAIMLPDESGERVLLLGELMDITARVTTRERYNSIISSSLDAFWRIDRSGNFLEVNDRACDLLGYQRDELLLMLRLQDVEYEVSEAETELSLLRLREQKFDRYETRFIRKDERVVDVELSVRFHDEDGGQFYVFARDVSEERLMRRELLASEQRFRRALENAPFPVMIRTEEGRILMLNRKWQEITGYTRQEIQTVNDWLERAYPDPQNRQNVQAIRDRISGGEDVRMEAIPVRCKDGSQRILSFSAIPLQDIYSDRRLIVTMAVDLTESFALQRELEAREEHYRSLLDTLAAGVVVHGPDGRILLSNDAANTILGLTHDRIIGLPATEQAWEFLREDRSIMPEEEYPVNLVLKTGEAIQDYIVGLVQPGREQPLWVLVNGNPEFHKDGSTRQVVVTFVDVTRQIEAQRALEKLSTNLQRSNTDLEQFAYIASHDLQEPLRMVTSYLKLIEQRYKDQLDDDGREFIGFAVDGARRMQFLIRDLLSYSRVGMPLGRLSPVPVGDVIDRVLTGMAESIAEQNARIAVSDDLPALAVDENQLAQLFQNLLGNALKFSRELPIVEVGARRDGAMWQFYVRDHGIGIPEKYHEKVFVIFQRLHSREEYPGTGIGLAICKRIVEGHGGRIWIDSIPGEGTTFYFTLPVVKED